MANGDDQIDIADAIRKRNLLIQDLPTIAGANQQQPTIPQNMPTVDDIPDQYKPQFMKPTPTPQMPPTTKFDTAATNLENLGAPPTATAKDPATGKDLYPRNKLAAIALAPFEFKTLVRDPLKARTNMDLITRKGLAQAELDYAQRKGQAQEGFKIQSDVLNQRLKIFTDQLNASKSDAEKQMAIGKYNQWVANLPQEQQYEALRLAELQANVNAAKAPEMARTPDSITYKKPDGTTSTTDGFIRTYKDPNKMPEAIVPGEKEPIPFKDVVRVTKSSTASSNPVMQQINSERQAIIDKQGYITPEQDDEIIKNARLLIQKGMQDRQELVRAQTTVGKHLNEDFIKPLDKKLLDLQTAKTSLQTAMGTNDPQQVKNAVAAVLSILDALRSTVGSGRVAVSEFPIITGAPGKPQSAVAYFRNLLGQGSPVPNTALNQLMGFINAQLSDVRTIKSMAANWSYKNLDAKTPKDAEDAGKGFDAALKAFQNPEKPTAKPATKPKSLEDTLKERGLIK